MTKIKWPTKKTLDETSTHKSATTHMAPFLNRS